MCVCVCVWVCRAPPRSRARPRAPRHRSNKSLKRILYFTCIARSRQYDEEHRWQYANDAAAGDADADGGDDEMMDADPDADPDDDGVMESEYVAGLEL